MKKILFTLLLLSITSSLYATREFYVEDDSKNITQISDVSDKKTIDDIKKDYPNSKVTEVTNDFQNKILQEKKVFADKQKQKEIDRQSAKVKLKKLGLTDVEIEAMLK